MRALNSLTGDTDTPDRARSAQLPERFEPGEATGPVTAGHDLFVVLDSLPEQPVGPVLGWQARSTPVAKGDRCLVVRVEDGDYWFVTWQIPGWTS